MNNALRSALQATEILDTVVAPTPRTTSATAAKQLDQSVKDYICACQSETCGNGNQLGDIVRRIEHAYVLAAPAAVYVDSDNGGSTARRPTTPFPPRRAPPTTPRSATRSTTSCAAATMPQDPRGQGRHRGAMADGHSNDLSIDGTVGHRVLRSHRKQRYVLCNSGANPTSAVQFCKDKLINSVTARAASTRPWVTLCGRLRRCCWRPLFGTPQVLGLVQLHGGHRRRLEAHSAMGATTAQVFENGEQQGTPPVYAICSSMLEFDSWIASGCLGSPTPSVCTTGIPNTQAARLRGGLRVGVLGVVRRQQG